VRSRRLGHEIPWLSERGARGTGPATVPHSRPFLSFADR
jgi:hypothetical protein